MVASAPSVLVDEIVPNFVPGACRVGAPRSLPTQERVALAPGEGELGEVDLWLAARLGLEAHQRLWSWSGPHLRHVELELSQADRVGG